MKKIRIWLLLCMVVLAFSACGKKGDEKDKAKEENPEEKVEVDISALYGSDVPTYQSAAGMQYPQSCMGDDAYEVYISGTTEEEFTAYEELLSQQGFDLYTKREVSAGSASAQKNEFYTYTTENFHVFLSWYPTLGEARIVMTPPGDLPSLEQPELTDADTVTETLTQIGLKGAGMLYVIQTPDGGFILIDAGYYRDGKDMMQLHDYLTEKTPEGQKIRIHMWMFTHGHQDHTETATAFLGKYNDEIEVESFAYNFPNLETMNTNGTENDESIVKNIESLTNAMGRYPDAKTYLLHAGQVYYFKGLEIEILQTEEEVYPEVAPTWNWTSASWRVKYRDGRQSVFLGDTTEKMSLRLANVYGDYLKSDILQVAHHGLFGGNLQLYQNINPPIVLWPTEPSVFYGTTDRYPSQYALGEGGLDYNAWIRDDSIQKREHYCHESTVTLEFK